MMERQTEFAYAKINRFLRVTGRRPDGYHTLRTVMQTVSLRDRLTFFPLPGGDGLSFSCSDRALETEDNLCLVAAKRFSDAAGVRVSGKLRLDKRIPAGAGLGGGSADAAAVLRLLQKRYAFPLSERELLELARTVGADVPFCLRGGKALCEGIGERISPMPDGKREAILLAKGEGSLSTPQMYRAIDAEREKNGFDGRTDDEGNDFEPAARAFLPEIGTYLEKLLLLGASESRMSGSGSAVFGVFASDASAKRAEAEFRRLAEKDSAGPVFTAVCSTVPRYE